MEGIFVCLLVITSFLRSNAHSEEVWDTACPGCTNMKLVKGANIPGTTKSLPTIQACLDYCDTFDECASIEYNAKGKCQINTRVLDAAGPDAGDKPGWVYCPRGYKTPEGKPVSGQCENGGECAKGECKCPEGTSGEFCEVAEKPIKEKPCVVANCNTCSEKNNKQCKRCDKGFKLSKNKKRCVKPCSIPKCKKCNKKKNRCKKCQRGYAPSKNKKSCNPKPEDPCKPNPCLNGGTCSNGKCSCPTGFKGDKCQTPDPCTPNPCQNGGTCTDGKCSCPPGYSGDKCEIKDPCIPNPCQNGGTCDNGACTCPNGYTGSNCENKDPCNPNPCQAGGTCSQGTCTCPQGRCGDFCERAAAPKQSCAAGWTLGNGNRGCYMASAGTRMNWNSANNWCRGRGGYLVVINDGGENSYVQNFIRGRGMQWSWIGMHDQWSEGNFQWSQGSSWYRNFAPGEPGNQGNEDCVYISTHNGKWNDNPCHVTPPLTCERNMDTVYQC